MEVTAAVLYKGALAHYTVTPGADGTFEAGLLKYSGGEATIPPLRLVFRKEGRHCTGNSQEQELMDDLYEAVKMQQDPMGCLVKSTHTNRSRMSYWQ